VESLEIAGENENFSRFPCALRNARARVAHQGASKAVLLKGLRNRQPSEHGNRHRVRHVAANTTGSVFNIDRAGREGVIGDDALIFAGNIGARRAAGFPLPTHGPTPQRPTGD
jgi:hypothetical protein